MEFLLVAGSYERLLYGLEAYSASPTTEFPNRKFEFKSSFIFPAHNGAIKCIAGGSDHFLATGSTDELIRLFDLKRRKELGTLMKHEGSITCLEFFQETHLLSGSEDGTLGIWRVTDWECLKVLKGHTSGINCLAIHPSGRLVMSVSKDNTLRIWDLLKGHQAACKRLPYQAIFVLYSPNGSYFCLLSETMVQVFAVGGDEAIFSIDNGSKKYISVIFYNDQYIALGSEHATIELYDFEKAKHCVTIKGHTKRIRSLSTVHLPSGSFLFSASTDGIIRGWDVSQKLKEKEVVELHTSDCIAAYNAEVRLTCLSIIVPNSSKPKTSNMSHPPSEKLNMTTQKRKSKENTFKSKKRA